MKKIHINEMTKYASSMSIDQERTNICDIPKSMIKLAALSVNISYKRSCYEPLCHSAQSWDSSAGSRAT